MVDKGASNADLVRCIENIVRAGSIMAVDHASSRCRVASGALTSDWLPWLSMRAGDVRRWSPPFVGEQCVMLSPGGNMAAALVLIGFFSDSNPANGDSADVERTTYPDGAVIEYDHAAHALKATLPEGGTADITVPDSITVRCKSAQVTCETVDVNASESATVHSQLITLDAPDTIATGNLTAMGLLTYAMGFVGTGVGATGKGAIIKGPVEVQEGDLTVPNNDVVAKGVSLVGHPHSDVQSGNDLSGGPVAT